MNLNELKKLSGLPINEGISNFTSKAKEWVLTQYPNATTEGNSANGEVRVIVKEILSDWADNEQLAWEWAAMDLQRKYKAEDE